MQISPYKPVL